MNATLCSCQGNSCCTDCMGDVFEVSSPDTGMPNLALVIGFDLASGNWKDVRIVLPEPGQLVYCGWAGNPEARLCKRSMTGKFWMRAEDSERFEPFTGSPPQFWKAV